MKKWLGMLLAGFAMLLCGMALPVSAAGEVWLYDESGNVLDKDEYTLCENRLKQAADYTNMNIGVIIGSQSRSDLTIESLTKSSYDEVFGHKTDGILYYMDMSGVSPYDYIATAGMGQFYYTNSDMYDRIDAMFTELDTYLKPVGNEDVQGAVECYAGLIEYYYDEGVPPRYYYYDDEERLYYHLDKNGQVVSTATKPYVDPLMVLFGAFGGLVAGLILALTANALIRHRYQFKFSLSPTTYVNRKEVQFYQRYDHFVRTYTSRVRINTDSGGGGGGGGGGHSSGGFGGGGHHR